MPSATGAASCWSSRSVVADLMRRCKPSVFCCHAHLLGGVEHLRAQRLAFPKLFGESVRMVKIDWSLRQQVAAVEKAHDGTLKAKCQNIHTATTVSNAHHHRQQRPCRQNHSWQTLACAAHSNAQCTDTPIAPSSTNHELENLSIFKPFNIQPHPRCNSHRR